MDPGLPLPLLRARSQLTELRATDLRFSFTEAAEFLNRVMGLDLATEDVAALDTRTEGWIAGLLQQRLHQRQSEQLPMLHRRSSGWHEQNGFANEAIAHALRGRHFERAAYLIEDQFGGNYERADQILLRRWLAAMPAELVSSNPHLCIIQAWNQFTSGQLEAADQSLRAAEELLDPGSEEESAPSSKGKERLPDSDRKKLLGRAAAMRSFLTSYNGNIPKTVQYARQALKSARTGARMAQCFAYHSRGCLCKPGPDGSSAQCPV